MVSEQGGIFIIVVGGKVEIVVWDGYQSLIFMVYVNGCMGVVLIELFSYSVIDQVVEQVVVMVCYFEFDLDVGLVDCDMLVWIMLDVFLFVYFV